MKNHENVHIDDDDIRARIYRQMSAAAYAYAEYRGWTVRQMVLCAIDGGRLAFAYLTNDEDGTRWYHVYLNTVERWAQERDISIPPIDTAKRPQQ